MLGLLVVSHGRLAEELVLAATRIVGPIEKMEAVSIDWDDKIDGVRDRIDDALKRVGGKDGILILTDMFGGTPTNIALSLLEPGKVEVITGVNLPMLIKFISVREKGKLSDISKGIAEQGRQAIHVASELLEGEGTPSMGKKN